MRENHSAYHKIWFRPRILHDVESIDLSTTMLGTKVDIPFYVTATALGKLGNPEGEVSQLFPILIARCLYIRCR